MLPYWAKGVPMRVGVTREVKPMDQQLPSGWQVLANVGRELVRFGIQEYLRQPRPWSRPSVFSPVPDGRPAYSPYLGPSVQFRSPPGCPWCFLARQAAGAMIYLQRAMIVHETVIVAAYVQMAQTILEETRGAMATLGGPIWELRSMIDDVQLLLRQPIDQDHLAQAVGHLGELIDVSLTRAEQPMPPPGNIVSGVAPSATPGQTVAAEASSTPFRVTIGDEHGSSRNDVKLTP
jgi:hypothetical protein